MVLKKPFTETTESEYYLMFGINSKAAYFFLQEAGIKVNDFTMVTSLLTAYTCLYSIYAGVKAPVEHFTRAASKEFDDRGISVTAVAPGARIRLSSMVKKVPMQFHITNLHQH